VNHSYFTDIEARHWLQEKCESNLQSIWFCSLLHGCKVAALRKTGANAYQGAAQSKAAKYSEAVLSFESALRTAGDFQSGGRRLLYTIDALAAAYAAAGQFRESAHQYRRGLALLEKSGGRDSLDYALLLGSLAATQPESLDTNTAIPTLQSGIALRDASAGQVTSLRNYLFQIYKDQGQYQEAESVLLEEQADFEKRNETDTAKQATLLNNLGLLRFNQKQYEEAKVLYDKSLRIREAGVGSHNPDLIEPLNNLASSLVELGRFKDAGSVFSALPPFVARRSVFITPAVQSL
jgi:tetratricopeptide (TPR) repeat protein